MHSTPDPSHVRFTGPLTRFAAGLVEELALLGYTATSATAQLQFAAHLSRWLSSQGMGSGDLTGPVIERFLAARRGSYTSHYSLEALEPTLGYLRREGVAPAAVVPAPSSPGEVLMGRYGEYLTEERGLSAPVARAYSHWVTPFVEDRTDGEGQVRFAELTAGDVAGFLTGQLPTMTRKTAQMTACALRSFLRFLHEEQMVAVALADAVPAVAHRRLSGLPQPLTPAQVTALLEACDRLSAVGCRDFAVITMLHRLGLRCAELTGLRLDDVDWQAGTLRIRGKGNRIDLLPLPVDVGQAIVDYLREGRPDTTARTVFVQARAPHTVLTSSGVSCIVARPRVVPGWASSMRTDCVTRRRAAPSTPERAWSRSRTCFVMPARLPPRSTPRQTRSGSRRLRVPGRQRQHRRPAAARHEHRGRGTPAIGHRLPHSAPCTGLQARRRRAHPGSVPGLSA
ncbi:MAG TPA: tyrosine-type recombinase/integrase [Dermatophilaceae bacterium]|nr:tyrosine-type recombinase/integrase [Dermatophilaceae bacterium]